MDNHGCHWNGDVKPNQDTTALDSVCHQDHRILLSRAAVNYSYRAFHFKRRCGGYCAVTSPFPCLAALVLQSSLLWSFWGKTGQLSYFLPFSMERENKQVTTHLSSARPWHLKWLPCCFTLGKALMICLSAETQENRDLSSSPKSLPTVLAQILGVQAVKTKLQVWGHGVAELFGILQDWT